MMGSRADAAVEADGKVVVVVSDMHIGDGAPTEPFARKDALFRRFLEHVSRSAEVLVIAGDGFDLAQAWSVERIYRAHRALVDDLNGLALCLPVYYLRGNHDGSEAQLRSLLPALRLHRQLTLGSGVLIQHGNAFDPHNLPGDERAVWGARIHALLEQAIRSPVRIPMRRHYCWSTRLGHWLFYRYGQYQRYRAEGARAAGDEAAARRRLDFLDYWGQGEWGDVHALLGAAQELLASQPYRTLVWGHAHQAGKLRFGDKLYLNTGSWTYQDATFVLLDGAGSWVKRWPESSIIGDEEYRGVLGEHRHKSFFDWWAAFYRGWLRYDVPAMHRAARGQR